MLNKSMQWQHRDKNTNDNLQFNLSKIFQNMLKLKNLRFQKDGVPPILENFIVNIEDKRFWYHFGIDIIALLRALLWNIRRKKPIQGGSTIENQLIRILLIGNNKKKIVRKIIEWILSPIMVLVLGKKKILKLYINNVYFGKNSFGIHEASKKYFGKSPKELSVSECFFLAERIARPSSFKKGRVKLILKKFYKKGILTKKDISEILKLYTKYGLVGVNEMWSEMRTYNYGGKNGKN